MALKSCLIRSECVLRQGHLPSECLKEHYDQLPDECKNLSRSLYECKRGMLDMRNRFRGNAAGRLSEQLEEEAKREQST